MTAHLTDPTTVLTLAAANPDAVVTVTAGTVSVDIGGDLYVGLGRIDSAAAMRVIAGDAAAVLAAGVGGAA